MKHNKPWAITCVNNNDDIPCVVFEFRSVDLSKGVVSLQSEGITFHTLTSVLLLVGAVCVNFFLISFRIDFLNRAGHKLGHGLVQV